MVQTRQTIKHMWYLDMGEDMSTTMREFLTLILQISSIIDSQSNVDIVIGRFKVIALVLHV